MRSAAAILAKGNVYAVCSGIAVATTCAWTIALAESTHDESTAPDITFLEYLGMWDESDEDWQLMNDDALQEQNDDRTEPDTKSDVSAENEDEN